MTLWGLGLSVGQGTQRPPGAHLAAEQRCRKAWPKPSSGTRSPLTQISFLLQLKALYTRAASRDGGSSSFSLSTVITVPPELFAY